jgi:hypothetical protein
VADRGRRLSTLTETRLGEAEAAMGYVLGGLNAVGPDRALGATLHADLTRRLRSALEGVTTNLGGAPRSPKIVGIAEVVQQHPDLGGLMKSSNKTGFVECGVAIITWPNGTDLPEVIGLFFVDVKEARKSKSAKRVKQDFVVYFGAKEKPWYCGGLPEGVQVDKTRKSIHQFCERFAKGRPGTPYGCYLEGTKWKSTNHHYVDEDDPNLPVEPEIRVAIAATLRAARGTVSR